MSDKVPRRNFLKVLAAAGALAYTRNGAALGDASAAPSGSLQCDLSGYKHIPGLTAVVANDVLTVTWDGERDEELRMNMAISGGTPTIQELALRRKGAKWTTLANNLKPEFRFVSGYRRMDQEQMEPVHDLGQEITPEIIARDKWNAFWDAPLMVPGTEGLRPGGGGDRPPVESVGGQPGLPRKPEEIHRGTAVYQADSCAVKTNGARLEITFPGVQLGTVFAGRLQYTVYKDLNLIRLEVIAKTEMQSVAYKYDAGLKGLAIQPASKIVWRDLDNQWQDYKFGGPVDAAPVVVQSANRLAAAEFPGGSIATFPPPHNFFWQSELAINLGNSWYSKESDSTFAFGVREAETQATQADAGRGPRDMRENWALRNARPGTWQKMPVYFYVGLEPGQTTIQSALAFTREDHFKPLPGYKVMSTHFHTDMVPRLLELGGLDATLPDFEMVKATGVNIWAPIDGGIVGPAGEGTNRDERVAALIAGGHADNLDLYYKAARLHSDKDFVVMPNEEIAFKQYGGLDVEMGGHNDLLVSHPVYWNPGRAAGQPLVEDHPKYGKVYHCGSPEDLMEMCHRENLLIYMPHPRAKGSTGSPDAMKDTAHFRDEHWRGIGFRWGLDVDGSEVRFSDYRCQPMFDDMNNWVADLPTPPKYIHAISEFFAVGYSDDFYANNPVDYIKLDELPGLDNWAPIINVMKRGDYFTTSGEVLIPSYAVKSTGNQCTIVADVEWTFPPEFAEVVWGSGVKPDPQSSTDRPTFIPPVGISSTSTEVGRKIIPLTDLPAFGKKHFEIPLDASDKKWVRFALWDSAGNGAMVQPVKLPSANNNFKTSVS